MRDTCSGSTLAIIEKEPTRKPGGCIGIFLHLFDWKKKKQFSRKLLPPVNAAKRALKRLGGQDKFAIAKQLPVSQESRGGSCSYQDSSAKEMCAPTMIARLMGLESMPNVHHENKQAESRKVCSKSKTLPKTTKLLKNRRSLGKDTFRLEMSLEEQHRVASVIQSQRRSPRRRKARLREVATRILEPGLQFRNASKFGITNFDSSVKIAGGSDMPSSHDLHVGSCANCGSLVEVMNLRVNGKCPEELDHEYRGSSSSSSSNFEVRREESLGRGVMQGCKKNQNVCNRERSFNTRNGHGRYRTPENLTLRKNQLASGIENYSSDSEANVIAGASSNSSGNRTLVMGRTRTGRGNETKTWSMELDKDKMIARRRPASNHHIACDELSGGDFLSQKRITKELPMRKKFARSIVSHPKEQSITRNELIEDIKSINGSKKEKQRIFLSFSSGRRHVTRSTCQLNMVGRNKCFNKVISGTSPKDSLLVDLRDKLSHLQDFEQNYNFQTDDCFPGINSLSILGRTSSFEKNYLCSAGYLDFSHQTFTDEQTGNINENIQENAKSRTRVNPISCDGETDVSYVEASTSSDSCCCLNHNCLSGYKQMECHSPENCTKMEERNAETDDSETLVDINRLHSSKLSAITGSKLFKQNNYPDEAQEEVRNGMQGRAKCNVATMLVQGENLQGQLLLDCMVESLDSLYDYFCHKSYEGFVRYQYLSKRRLAELVEEKIIRWQHMDSKSPVELTKQEIQLPTNIDWLELMTGRIELSKNIEEDTLALIINELVVDLFRC
ncbi:uncharacterized protein LOC122025495 [Zingiber officinale]|uniref:uncharacterized protein LOC122025495 n=1 Tax=Zingiber officinale TaxID=94328 RepID=UPI001C4BC12B|nr:uncharacterized protein LOC122025495 [Zingiber officinale]